MAKQYFLLIFFFASSITLSQETYNFNILINNKSVGYYQAEINEIDDRVEVKTSILIKIRFLFIPLFNLTNTSSEQWADSCLESIHSLTTYGPRESLVKGNKINDKFIVTTNRRGEINEFSYDGCTRSLAFWDSQLLQSNELLNPFNGRNEESSYEINIDPVNELIMENLLNLNGTKYILRYDQDGRWIGLSGEVRDRLIEFIPAPNLNQDNH
jgi:hypothetical protein